MAVPRRQGSRFTSPQSNPDSERLAQEVERLVARVAVLQAQVDAIDTSGSGSGAPVNASYVTIANNGTLTDERRLVAGANITITDGGANSTVTIASTGGTTEEQVEDWVAGLVTDSASISWVYNDGAGTLTGSVITEHIQDIVGNLVADTATITWTYDDPGGTLTANVDPTGLPVDQLDYTYYEVDFSSLATNAFTNGTEVIDGINWMVANSAGAGASWGIVNGQGLRWSAPTSSAQTWTVASPTGPHVYVPLGSIPNLSTEYPLIMDIRITASTFENGNDAMRWGMWGVSGSPISTSTNRARIADRGSNSGTITVRSFDGTTVNACPDAVSGDVFSLRCEPSGFMYIGFGTWSGGWPTSTSIIWSLVTTAGPTVQMFHAACRFVFAFINVSDASPTSAVTIERLRFRRG